MEVGVFGDIGLNVVLFVVIWVLENVIDYVIILFYRMVGKFVRVKINCKDYFLKELGMVDCVFKKIKVFYFIYFLKFKLIIY